MVRVYLQHPAKFLESPEVISAHANAKEFYSLEHRSQARYNWPHNPRLDKELKFYLSEAFYNKCGYCERKIERTSVGTIDRYRPNTGVKEKRQYFEDLYWWLVFDWSNLIYCCRECNTYKSNFFPVKGARAKDVSSDLTVEHRMLLSPYLDFPDDHLRYNEMGGIYAISDEGQQTIELLRLDRTSLVEERRSERLVIIRLIEQVLKKGAKGISEAQLKYLRNIYDNDPTIQFLAFKRWVLLAELDSTPFLGQMLKIDDFAQEKNLTDYFDETIRNNLSNSEITVNDYFPIEYVHITNFKSISELKINFKDDEVGKKSWLFLLGENGVGKSSILQAIAIGLKLDHKVIDPLIPYLIRKGQQSAQIVIKERNRENLITTKLVRRTNSATQSGLFSSYLIGYGSLRLSVDEIDDRVSRDTEVVSYENLFRSTKALNDVTKWLRAIAKRNPNFFDRICYSIKQLLPHDKSDVDLSIKKGKIILGNSGVSFSDLSDGYRSTMTLAIDIMMKLSNAHSDMDKMTGIVLVDELGNQLHPRWQMRIVSQLRTVFPNINFIISTHHPLCLRGAENNEILLLRDTDKKVVTNVNLPDPSTLRVDQILASEFFGLNSVIDPELEAKFNRYYSLLAVNKELTHAENLELDELKDFLRDKQQLGNTLREELMYTVLDRLLAEQVYFNKNAFDRTMLKDEAVSRVKSMWKNLNIGNND